MEILDVFYKMTKIFFGTYYYISHLFVYNIFKIIAQFTKYRNDDLLDIFIIKVEGKVPCMMGLELGSEVK